MIQATREFASCDHLGRAPLLDRRKRLIQIANQEVAYSCFPDIGGAIHAGDGGIRRGDGRIHDGFGRSALAPCVLDLLDDFSDGPGRRNHCFRCGQPLCSHRCHPLFRRDQRSCGPGRANGTRATPCVDDRAGNGRVRARARGVRLGVSCHGICLPAPRATIGRRRLHVGRIPGSADLDPRRTARARPPLS